MSNQAIRLLRVRQRAQRVLQQRESIEVAGHAYATTSASLGPRPLNIAEVAHVYGRSEDDVEALIATGALPVMRLSRRTIRFAWRNVIGANPDRSRTLTHPDCTPEGVSIETRRRPASFVYFASAQGTNLVKIGVSRTPEARLSSLRTMSGTPLSLLALVEGDRTIEQRLHRCFAADRQHGEWFLLSEPLRRFVYSCRSLGRLPERWPRPR